MKKNKKNMKFGRSVKNLEGAKKKIRNIKFEWTIDTISERKNRKNDDMK